MGFYSPQIKELIVVSLTICLSGGQMDGRTGGPTDRPCRLPGCGSIRLKQIQSCAKCQHFAHFLEGPEVKAVITLAASRGASAASTAFIGFGYFLFS